MDAQHGSQQQTKGQQQLVGRTGQGRIAGPIRLMFALCFVLQQGQD